MPFFGLSINRDHTPTKYLLNSYKINILFYSNYFIIASISSTNALISIEPEEEGSVSNIVLTPYMLEAKPTVRL